MIGLDTLLDLIDRFDVPTLAVLTWLWIRGNRLANKADQSATREEFAKVLGQTQEAFVNSLSQLDKRMEVSQANFEALASNFNIHVEHDREDSKALVSALSDLRKETHDAISALRSISHV